MITFHADYPIHVLYKKVLVKLEGMDKDVYSNEYNRYKRIADESNNPEDRAIAHSKVVRMEGILRMLEDGTLVSTFKSRAQPLLVQYFQVQGNGYVFGMNLKSDAPKRVHIIISFLKMVNEFVNVEWECTFNMGDVCPSCHRYMEKKGIIMVCKGCGESLSLENTSISISNEDNQKVSTYKSPKNYRKEYNHLCGIIHSCENDEIPTIQSYLYKTECSHPTRDDIRQAISSCGYRNYNDTNYIYSQITGDPLPPIADYVSACADRFEKYHGVFVELQIPGNVTNLHFLTKLFLYQEKVPAQDDWFRTLSPSTEKRHRGNAIRICRILASRYSDQDWTVPPEWEK